MEYTHKVTFDGDETFYCCLHNGVLYYTTDYGDYGSFKAGMTSIVKFYSTEEGYVVTKLNKFTGNT